MADTYNSFVPVVEARTGDFVIVTFIRQPANGWTITSTCIYRTIFGPTSQQIHANLSVVSVRRGTRAFMTMLKREPGS